MSRTRSITIIDYGMGNLRSVEQALKHVAGDTPVIVSDDATEIAAAERIVFPGQGAAADCMAAIARAGLVEVIAETLHSRPFFGICMGLQVLMARSDENGGVDCLGLVAGHCERFASPLLDAHGTRLKVPHMGWSKVQHTLEHPLWHGIEQDSRFYFAHSYYAVPAEQSLVAARCEYGHDFPVALAMPGFFACQFHPEKSADNGLRLLKNFVAWSGE